MSSDQDHTAPATDRAIELLNRESLSATERIERVEELLKERPTDVDDALARYAAAGEQHVLASDRGEYEAFLELCETAVRKGHAIEVTALVRRSLDGEADPGALEWEIQSNDALTDEQVTERLSLLSEAVEDDESTVVGAADGSDRDAAEEATPDDDGGSTGDTPATEDARETTGTARESFPAGASARRSAIPRGSPGAESDGADEEFGAATSRRTDEGSTGADSAEADDDSEPGSSTVVDAATPPGGTTEDEAESEIGESDAEPETGESDAESEIGESDGESVDGADEQVEAGAVDDVPDDVDVGPGVDGTGAAPDDDRHREPLRPPQRTDPTEQGAFSMPNYAQDLVRFDFVLDSDDSFVPNDVRGSGIVVVDDEEYVGIVRVKPRSWSIHTNEKKAEIIDGYKSSFLATLDFPVQIVSYPTKFDISDHVERLSDVVEEGHTRSTDSKLVNVGRELYPNWLERFIQDNDMKQRQLYIVVPLSAHQINDFADTNDGFLDQVGEKVPPLKPLADFLGDDDGIDVTEQQCLRELDSRLSHVGSGLRRFDVEVERLADRDEVMSVLYHYYNNEQPLNDAFPTGPYSTVEPETGTRR